MFRIVTVILIVKDLRHKKDTNMWFTHICNFSAKHFFDI
jgi:hypothetical protein